MKTGNQAIIENSMNALANRVGNRRTSMLIQSMIPPVLQSAEDNSHNNSTKIKEVERESKEMYEGVQKRLNKLESSIINIENTL